MKRDCANRVSDCDAGDCGAVVLPCACRRGRLHHYRLLLALPILVAVVASPAHSQNADQIFNDAVSAYQRGRFDSAAVGFQSIVRRGIDDERVWYNLGNSQFKMHQIGHALVSYRRGLRIAPRDADLKANLRYARLFAADKIETVGEFFLEQWWQKLVSYFSVYETRGITAVLFWLAAAVTVWRLWPQARHLPNWRVIAATWVLWVVVTGAAATCYVRDAITLAGAVTTVQTNVRGGPGQDYALQFVAHDGLMGTVERTESGWHLVRFPNGAKGWVAVSDFEII